MAGGSLLALLDDIATVLDDVGLMAKVAAKKTAGVLGDDLALNAEQVSGVRAQRELPVIWAVAKGSAINKLILVPIALVISVIAPWLVLPLLMCGGLYLCYEGIEKIAHKFIHPDEANQEASDLINAFENPTTDMAAFERDKIKGAIRTDFVLSAEIIVIALGTVSDQPLLQKVLVVSLIAAVVTVGVYGLVALIVKLDDIGLYLLSDKRQSAWSAAKRATGSALLRLCPWLMKSLSVIGTVAMFLVGGGILVHGLPVLHHLVEHWAELVPGAALMANMAVGLVAGVVTLTIVSAGKTLLNRQAS